MFNILDFIELKRDGHRHSSEDLHYFVKSVLSGQIPDYQISAWLMAAFIRGMDDEELRDFTSALAFSGDVFRLSAGKRAVDKHSTGGVGDKTTLIAAPLAASCGLPVAKLSGCALGFTGGTVDKLKSIPGMNMHLDTDQFIRQIDEIGIAISGHSLHLAPAEGKFYALRDVTGTVPSLPLIASSIVSKKIAGGADAFVFDVKCGNGAFMKTEGQARALCAALISLSAAMAKRSMCVISDMEQPLGRWVGNSVEVLEALQVLSGAGPSDTRELSATIAAEMLMAGGITDNIDSASMIVAGKLDDKSALRKFAEMISCQGGDPSVCGDPESILPRAAHEKIVTAPREGVIGRMDALTIGIAARALGGGRTRGDDKIDQSVGIGVLKKIGDAVSNGEPIFEIRYNRDEQLNSALPHLISAFSVAEFAEKRPLILDRVTSYDR
ncbi:MAG: thymidine phosphorylase [Synergistaceae bacterium]|jgi:pyrimidine-nucleoside phosphorylase|nr:thymidine phosphorylase [Synergistaceae bacterium]